MPDEHTLSIEWKTRGYRMINVQIPGRSDLVIESILLDVNGTLALDGELVEGVAERVGQLRKLARLVILTADTHGGATRLGEYLGLEVVLLDPHEGAPQKLKRLLDLDADSSATIGNGANDVLMLERSALGICVVGREGASTEALLKADIVVTDIRDALDLFLNPRRVAATLRK
jgi:soluble P-type ATPase